MTRLCGRVGIVRGEDVLDGAGAGHVCVGRARVGPDHGWRRGSPRTRRRGLKAGQSSARVQPWRRGLCKKQSGWGRTQQLAPLRGEDLSTHRATPEVGLTRIRVCSRQRIGVGRRRSRCLRRVRVRVRVDGNGVGGASGRTRARAEQVSEGFGTLQQGHRAALLHGLEGEVGRLGGMEARWLRVRGYGGKGPVRTRWNSAVHVPGLEKLAMATVLQPRRDAGATPTPAEASRAPSISQPPRRCLKKGAVGFCNSRRDQYTHRSGKTTSSKWEIRVETGTWRGRGHDEPGQGKERRDTETGDRTSARARVLLARVVLGQVDTTGSRAALRAASTGRTARARSSRSARLGHERVERNLFRCTKRPGSVSRASTTVL